MKSDCSQLPPVGLRLVIDSPRCRNGTLSVSRYDEGRSEQGLQSFQERDLGRLEPALPQSSIKKTEDVLTQY